MSKNHPHDNIYSILGKLEKLEAQDKPAATAPKAIYESVESQGSILKGLRKVSDVESRLSQQFAESQEIGVPQNTSTPNSQQAQLAAMKPRVIGGNAAAARRNARSTAARMEEENCAECAMGECSAHGMMEGAGAFTPEDIQAAIDYKNPIGHIYKIANGKIRFKLLNMDRNALNKILSRPLATQQDWDALKKQMKQALTSQLGEEGQAMTSPGMMESDDDAELKLLDACAAIYRVQYDGGDEIWDADWMQDWAHSLRQANPTDQELDFIIANGHMPKRLADVEFDVGDDFQFGEGITTHQSGKTTHTKTDYPGYPVSDLDKDDEEERKAGKKGRPRKAQTKNPRRDPAAEKKGRGRPKKDPSTSGEIRATNKSHDPFGRVAAGAHKRASVAESMTQLATSLLQELNEGRHMVDESGEALDHILNRFKHDVKRFEAGEDIYGTDLYHALFDYYSESGEMPYGTQKARDGDPVEFITDRLELALGDQAYGADPANAEGFGIKDEAIDPTNPRDYELPAFLRKQQGQAPLTARDIMQKDKKPEHDFYQRRTGETHPDALKTELDELAQLAGLSEVSRGEYIKQQDTAAEKSGKNEFNAFGQLFKTDDVNEDPEAEFEGNEFSGNRQDAIDAGKDHFDVDGEEYPVQEDKIEVDTDDEENVNKPKPKYGSIKAITTQGDDLNRQKRQDPHTANRAANPLTNQPTLESQLAAEYESIKKSTK